MNPDQLKHCIAGCQTTMQRGTTASHDIEHKPLLECLLYKLGANQSPALLQKRRGSGSLWHRERGHERVDW
uniref:Uncharacterized protein n=1 Tax=Zea mays TaxID=4577 RepID=C0PP61_MAIZE|nr:unknown [Zea mays]